MGARARRRLAIAGIAALIVASAVTALVITQSGSHASKEVFGTFGAFGVTDGMRSAEVLARFGAPDQKRSGCWIYRIREGTFHGIKLLPQVAGIDAVRYCFYGGVVTVIEDHWRLVNGISAFGQPWIAPLTFGCGGKPCQRSQ